MTWWWGWMVSRDLQIFFTLPFTWLGNPGAPTTPKKSPMSMWLYKTTLAPPPPHPSLLVPPLPHPSLLFPAPFLLGERAYYSNDLTAPLAAHKLKGAGLEVNLYTQPDTRLDHFISLFLKWSMSLQSPRLAYSSKHCPLDYQNYLLTLI